MDIEYQTWLAQKEYWKKIQENADMENRAWNMKREYWKQKLENAEIEYDILKLKLKKAQGF